jgi:hypothetical protein
MSTSALLLTRLEGRVEALDEKISVDREVHATAERELGAT